MKTLATEVTIIGGGIVGASAALFLRQQGIAVIVLEGARCGAKASGVNYGGVRRQGRSLDQMPLSTRAHELWAQLPALIGTDGEYVRSGHLKLATTQDDFAELARYKEQTRGFGMHLQLLGPQQLKNCYPWLGKSLAGASLCPDDGHANPRLVSPAFAWAARRAGAIIHEECPVTGAAHDGQRFVVRAGDGLEVRSSYLLNCAGAWGKDFARMFGDTVPESSLHPQMMVTEPLPLFMQVSLGMHGGGIYARQVARGNVVLGGGREFGQSPAFAQPSQKNMLPLLHRVAEVIPQLQGAHVIRFWSGVEGRLPDNNPVIGASTRIKGLFHAFGLCGAGFQIGPAVGEVLADLVVKGHAKVGIEPFRIDRFSAEATM